jgi:polyisoprenoid-binding protein YceI
MALQGTHQLGPENARLLVKTKRTGAAAKAGHNLTIEVTAWSATLDSQSASLEADPASLRVIEGSGGMQALDDDDKANIEQTIRDEVLTSGPIEFRSTEVAANGDSLRLSGELNLMGATRPLALDVSAGGDGALRASAVVRQSDWGIKPYSGLFGALKVVDEIEVLLEPR